MGQQGGAYEFGHTTSMDPPAGIPEHLGNQPLERLGVDEVQGPDTRKHPGEEHEAGALGEDGHQATLGPTRRYRSAHPDADPRGG